jgi:hypothetical protein
VFGGTTLRVGSTGTDVTAWQREMNERWSGKLSVTGTYSLLDANETRRFQAQAGLPQTGEVNSATWAAAFQVGTNVGDLTSAHLAPLDQDRRTEPFLYNAAGAIIGGNPQFDSRVVRVESWDNYGSRVRKDEAIASAAARRVRDAGVYFGSILFETSDPEECSRFDIEPGKNILVKNHRGTNRLLHIASVVNNDFKTVEIEVDGAYRDMQTLAQIRDRNREATDPGKFRTYRNSRSRMTVNDRSVYDCEGGAGVVPFQAIDHEAWQVCRIPMGAIGSVKGMDFKTDSPAEYTVGVFDREITVATLNNWGDFGLTPGYWDDILDENDELQTLEGLKMAWGDGDEPMGYYPGSFSDGTAMTGIHHDDATWTFESTRPPWIWVAMFVSFEDEATHHIQGRFYPDLD